MALMDVKTASLSAKKYLVDLFEDEGISNVGLEEVEFDELSNSWRITIGFSRPWDTKNVLTATLGERNPARSYKVVRIDDLGRVKSLTDRVLPTSES